jgi:GT2 family glycosyltransferase
MRASVVIPTRDRRALLTTLLGRVLPQAASAGAEVVVVDNGSRDGTREAVEALAVPGGTSLRCVDEPIAGATRARNTGARAARGTIVAYVDDDALPAPDWLAALLAAFDDPRLGGAGGRVALRFDGPPPAWWDAALADYLAAYDLGPASIDLATRPWYDAPRGDNMAFRRDALLAVGGFDERLGPRAGRPSVGEESELCLRLRAAGWGVGYVPGAAVEHLVDPARLEPAWFFRRAFWTGWSEAMIDLRHRGLRAALGRFRWHYRARLLRLSGDLRRRCERREAAGYLLGVLRYAPASSPVKP